MFGYASVTLSLSEYISQIHDHAENDFAALVELTKSADGKYLSLPKNITNASKGPSLSYKQGSKPGSLFLNVSLDPSPTSIPSSSSTGPSLVGPSSSGETLSSAGCPGSPVVSTYDFRAPSNSGLERLDLESDDEFLVRELMETPHRAVRRFYMSGVPAAQRVNLWLHLTHARELALHNHGLYAYLCTKDSRYRRTIAADVSRTLPGHEGFGEVQQGILTRVLSAYSLYCTDVGYSQGLNYVVAPLILLVEDEDEIFWSFVAMMKDKNLERFYHSDGIYFRIVSKTFEDLLSAHFPALAAHLKKQGVTPELYLPQWFRTFFLYTDNLELNLRVVDCFLLHGVEALFRIALAIFELLQPELLSLSFIAVVQSLTSLAAISDTRLLMTTAFAQQITFLLPALEIMYRTERERRRDAPCLFQ